MPYHYAIIEQRLYICNAKIRNLFDNQQDNIVLQQAIAQVEQYYRVSFSKAINTKTEEVVNRYESFIEQLTQVKNGQLNSRTALDAISKACESRKAKILSHNLTKICESIFYASTAFSLYTGVWWVALPILLVQPLVGIAVFITFVGAIITAAHKSLSCLSEFRSTHRHNNAYTYESSLISFFNQEPPPEEEQDHNVAEVDWSLCF